MKTKFKTPTQFLKTLKDFGGIPISYFSAHNGVRYMLKIQWRGITTGEIEFSGLTRGEMIRSGKAIERHMEQIKKRLTKPKTEGVGG